MTHSPIVYACKCMHLCDIHVYLYVYNKQKNSHKLTRRIFSGENKGAKYIFLPSFWLFKSFFHIKLILMFLLCSGTFPHCFPYKTRHKLQPIFFITYQPEHKAVYSSNTNNAITIQCSLSLWRREASLLVPDLSDKLGLSEGPGFRLLKAPSRHVPPPQILANCIHSKG